MRQQPPTLRRVLASALAALTAAVGILTLAVGFSTTPLVRVVQVLTVIGLGAIVVGGAIVLVLVHLADWRAPEEDFELMVRRAERLASDDPWGFGEYEESGVEWDEEPEEPDDLFDVSDEEDFRALVRSALDELPLEYHRALEHVAIAVAESGARAWAGRGRRHVYGIYEGDTVAEDYFRDRIVLFRDTLVRDFGRDPDRLREQVVRTVRQELSHHLDPSLPGA
jgi:predicted Zn-dependent protease with MMP-like domain